MQTDLHSRPFETRLIASLLIAGSIPACSDGFGPPQDREGEALQTDRTRYVATRVPGTSGIYVQYGFTAIVTFANRGGETVYLNNCYANSTSPTYGVELVSSDERSGLDPAWACVGHDRQLAVPPGASRVDTLFISGPNGWQAGVPTGVLEGVFQLRYRVRTGPGESAPSAPDSLSYSNRFEVRVDR
jgi:hypothetical protein